MSAPPYQKGPDTPVQFLKGVGPELAKQLAKLGITNVGELLGHYPRRYEDRSQIPPISTIRPGQHVTVRGRLAKLDARPVSGNRVLIRALLTDQRSGVFLVWFNQPWVKRKLEHYQGEIIAYGLVKEGQTALEIHSPEYELLDEDGESEFARITPIYPLSEGVFQWLVRKAMAAALLNYLETIPDPLPDKLLRHYDLKPLRWALSQIHQPTSEANRLDARKRLVFEEFFVLQMALQARRAQAQLELGTAFALPDDLEEQLRAMLPFSPTGAQERVIREIWADMARAEPMNRLMQGDVGSGKTAVAAAAILACVRGGFQAAIMAPTEILAEQHAASFSRFFEEMGIRSALLVGKMTAKQKEKLIAQVVGGEIDVAIGTHALIQEGVAFRNLGLAVIDEQHRFGVMQRAALKGKASGNPDVLVMTATPIPRTLTMSIYGDLDLSVIDELPPGRQPIKTHWRFPMDRAKIYGGVRKLIEEGRQAYFVCPMVSENEKMQAQAAEELYLQLTKNYYPDLRVGLLHGQMKARAKEAVMDQFRRHELDILVSTTVIEVGVDVPNASVMVIEDANRFGLSQLHQLRGRVGRGSHQSFCILIADPKNEDAKARMEIMVATNDGFKIAEEDLKIRGPGEIAGTRQSGNLDFKVADLIQDGKVLEVARQAAMKLIKYDPSLSRPEHRLLRERVHAREASVDVGVVA